MPYRVLHVISTMGQGGAEHQLLLNLATLDRNLFENSVCCIREEGALADDVTALGIPIYTLRVPRKLGWPRAVFRLQGLISSLKIDLLHTSLVDADIIGGLAGRLNIL